MSEKRYYNNVEMSFETECPNTSKSLFCCGSMIGISFIIQEVTNIIFVF